MSEKPRDNSEEEKVPEQQPELVLENVEMPETFVEPQGKSGKWGEVVENKELGVSYREKVIELPKHRQEETGIKRIRRRELLPPFPEDLYLLPERIKATALEEVRRRYEGDLADHGTSFNIKMAEKDITETEYYPSYNSSQEFDAIYKYLTDDIYPAADDYVHILNYRLIHGKDYPKERALVQNFKNEGLYFQEVYNSVESTYNNFSQEDLTGNTIGYLSLNTERMVTNQFATPVFIFSKKNSVFNEYVNKIISDNSPEFLLPKKVEGLQSLRWCNAQCALIPTKRNLNVLFFETED